VREQVNGLLERVGLSPGESFAAKKPHELSGGQRQRVVIARALAARPRLILADEPTSALDVSNRLDIMNLLLDLTQQEGLSMLFITHDLARARYMADRIAVMYTGHIVEIGPTDRVIDAPQMPYTRLLKSAAPKPELGLVPERIEAHGEVSDLSRLPPGCPPSSRAARMPGPPAPKACPGCTTSAPATRRAASCTTRCSPSSFPYTPTSKDRRNASKTHTCSTADRLLLKVHGS